MSTMWAHELRARAGIARGKRVDDQNVLGFDVDESSGVVVRGEALTARRLTQRAHPQADPFVPENSADQVVHLDVVPHEHVPGSEHSGPVQGGHLMLDRLKEGSVAACKCRRQSWVPRASGASRRPCERRRADGTPLDQWQSRAHQRHPARGMGPRPTLQQPSTARALPS